MDFKELFRFQEGTQEAAAEGGLCVLEKILYYLFKSPFAIWRMSCKHLKEIRNEAKLDIEKIDSPIPYILFLIRFTFDFLLHALIFLTFVLAPVAAIVVVVNGIVDASGTYTIQQFFSEFFATFAAFYYAPLGIRLVIEILVIIKKFGLSIL